MHIMVMSLHFRPEDVIPINSTKPPKPPRALFTDNYRLCTSQPEFYASQPELSTLPTYTPEQFSLKDSLSQFVSSSTSNSGSSNYKQFSGYRNTEMEVSENWKTNANVYDKSNTSNSVSLMDDTDYGFRSGAVRHFCSRCGDKLSAIPKRKAQCKICIQWTCKPCAMWEPKHDGYICEQHTEEEGYR